MCITCYHRLVCSWTAQLAVVTVLMLGYLRQEIYTLEKFFSCQRQRGATHDNPNALEFLRNTQALRIVNTASCVVKGSCRGTRRQKLIRNYLKDRERENECVFVRCLNPPLSTRVIQSSDSDLSSSTSFSVSLYRHRTNSSFKGWEPRSSILRNALETYPAE